MFEMLIMMLSIILDYVIMYEQPPVSFNSTISIAVGLGIALLTLTILVLRKARRTY